MKSQNLIASYFLSTLFRAFTRAGLFSPPCHFLVSQNGPIWCQSVEKYRAGSEGKKKGAALSLRDCRGEIKPAIHATVGEMLRQVCRKPRWEERSDAPSEYTAANVNMPITARRSAGGPPPSACSRHPAGSSPLERGPAHCFSP